MCFKNLPIEFDAEGKTRLQEGLKEGVADPWVVRREHQPFAELRQLAPGAREARGERYGALTQVAGAHAFHSLVVYRRARAFAPRGPR
ncbi:MAG: hypothetical protein M3331_06210 [Actinomycetota bacterium]|nr:hypothetical protein [Actinomycetota bacterium]